jgi:hypothetical protein
MQMQMFVKKARKACSGKISMPLFSVIFQLKRLKILTFDDFLVFIDNALS